MSSQPQFQSPYPRPDLDHGTGPACPQCGSRATKKVKYTWWGGLVGPSLFSLMKCEACKCQFNGKTGKPALQAIIVYNVVIWAIAFVVGFAIFFLRR